MAKCNDNTMSRGEFLKKSSAGLIGFGILGGHSATSDIPQRTFDHASPCCRTLGRTGMKVAPVGCGATRTMEPAVIKAALDAGMNFIDTGRTYANGRNEVMIGRVIQGMRQEIIIQSKITLNIRERGEELHKAEVASRITRQMQQSLEGSLKALGTDYIDSMLLHNVADTDLIDHPVVREFFITAKEKGVIRAHGYSSHGNHVVLLRGTNEDRFYDVVMIPYNHKGSYVHSQSGRYDEWDQAALEAELRRAEQNNIGIVAMKTCSAGPCAPDEGIEPSYAAALQWVLGHSYISTMAVAVASMGQIHENLKSIKL